MLALDPGVGEVFLASSCSPSIAPAQRGLVTALAWSLHTAVIERYGEPLSDLVAIAYRDGADVGELLAAAEYELLDSWMDLPIDELHARTRLVGGAIRRVLEAACPLPS